MRSTTEVFEDHLHKRLHGDVEGDIRENYAKEVVLLTGTGVFRGHDGVRESARELEKYTKGMSFTYQHTITEDEYAFLEWTAEDDTRSVPDGADGFVIKDGKIIMQNIHYSLHEERS